MQIQRKGEHRAQALLSNQVSLLAKGQTSPLIKPSAPVSKVRWSKESCHDVCERGRWRLADWWQRVTLKMQKAHARNRAQVIHLLFRFPFFPLFQSFFSSPLLPVSVDTSPRVQRTGSRASSPKIQPSDWLPQPDNTA